MIKRVRVTQNTIGGRRTTTVAEKVPFGLTVHSVPLAVEPNVYGLSYLDRQTGGGSFLEGILSLNEDFQVPNLGVKVRLLQRIGNKSVVQVEVKDLHQVVTENIERVALGTLNAFSTLNSLLPGRALSPQERSALSTLSNLVGATYGVLEGSNTVAPSTYEAAKDVQDIVVNAELISRQLLKGTAAPVVQRARIGTLRRYAAQYLRYARGASR